MKKETRKHNSYEARYFYDKYGVMVCECPRCSEYIANVYLGAEILCPKCGWKFKVVE